MNREEMLMKLRELDFYTLDMNLYLDTHPYDREAQSQFNAVAVEANMLREQYEQEYGPLTTRQPIDESPWEWIENPWPWNNHYSHRLMGGDR